MAQPLNNRVPIINPDGTPTDYFIRLLQDRGIVLDDKISVEEAEVLIDTAFADTDVIAGTGLDGGGSLAADVTLDLADTAVTPGTYGDATNVPQITVDQQGRITDVLEVAITGGGGSAAWSLHTTWTYSSPVASVPFTGLAGINELLIVVRGLSLGTSGAGLVQVSTNNGSSYYTASGNYVTIPADGTSANTIGATFWTGNTTAARSGAVHIINPAVLNAEKYFVSPGQNSAQMRAFVADNANDIDAFQVVGTAGGNITGGTIYVFKR